MMKDIGTAMERERSKHGWMDGYGGQIFGQELRGLYYYVSLLPAGSATAFVRSFFSPTTSLSPSPLPPSSSSSASFPAYRLFSRRSGSSHAACCRPPRTDRDGDPLRVLLAVRASRIVFCEV